MQLLRFELFPIHTTSYLSISVTYERACVFFRNVILLNDVRVQMCPVHTQEISKKAFLTPLY